MRHVAIYIVLLILPVTVRSQDFKKHFEINFSGIVNTYKSDAGGNFQLGTYPVQLEYGGGFGIGSGGAPYAEGEMDGVHEKVTSSGLPAPVVAWAGDYSPAVDLKQTSLRLQNSYGGDAGVYVARDLRLGGRFCKNSWRYDYLGYGAGTTIPYVKGIQYTYSLFANYTKDAGNWRFMLDAGAGKATVNFVSGVESYLADGDGQTLSKLHGVAVPVSAGFGRVFHDDGMKIVPFVRYGMDFTTLSGGTGVRRSLLDFGVQFGSR